MSQHKDLGVTFSTDLHWTEHYNIIIAKAYQTLGLLRRTFSVGSTAAKKQLAIHLTCKITTALLLTTMEASTTERCFHSGTCSA